MGVAGIIGTAGLVCILALACSCDSGRGPEVGRLDEGVVGWVESDSEGACDVAGVSKSDTGTAATSFSLIGSVVGISPY